MCKRLDADTFTDTNVIALSDKFIPVKVNPEIKDQPINEETRKKFNVRGFPAILFVSSDGGLIKRHSGYAKPEQFLPVMQEALKSETEFQETLAKLKKMPDDVTLNREIAILYLKRQQIEKALPISAKMPDDVKLNREFGIYYLSMDDIKKALTISEKMPDDVKLNREFGIYYLGKNDIKKALIISEKMPDDVKLNNEFAIAYLRQKNIEKALPFSEKVFAKDPKNMTGLLPDLHMQLGFTYHDMIEGKSEDVAAENANKAVMHLQKIIDVYPKSNMYEFAQYYLGSTYSLNGQFDKSIAVLEKLISHTTNERMKKSAEEILQGAKESAAKTAHEDN